MHVVPKQYHDTLQYNAAQLLNRPFVIASVAIVLNELLQWRVAESYLIASTIPN